MVNCVIFSDYCLILDDLFECLKRCKYSKLI